MKNTTKHLSYSNCGYLSNSFQLTISKAKVPEMQPVTAVEAPTAVELISLA